MKLIIAYSRNSTQVTTTYEYLTAFKKYWPGDVSYIHVTNEASIWKNFEGCDVLLHNYCARLCFDGYVSESYKEAVRNFTGVKVLSVQDEYDRTDALKAAIKDLDFDIVLTCVPEDQVELVYPGEEFRDVKFLTVLTGYIDEPEVISGPRRALEERPNVVGYRGRNIGLRYGQLGFDKYEIGRRVAIYCQDHGINHDIAMEDADRIYGPQWSEFIRSCRTMLGSESGSNVFDFKGHFEESLKGIDCKSSEAQEILAKLRSVEKSFNIGQISPRVFECAQNYTPMILYEGRYSDIIEPNQHYLPLKKDHSNIEEIFQAVERIDDLERMATRTYEHLVGSGRYSYSSFVDRVAQVVQSRHPKLSVEPQRLDGGGQQERGAHLKDLPRQKLTALPKVGPEADVEHPYEIVTLVYLPVLKQSAAAWDNATALANSNGFSATLRKMRARYSRKTISIAVLMKKVAELIGHQLTGHAAGREGALKDLLEIRRRRSEARQLSRNFRNRSEILQLNGIALEEFQGELHEIETLIIELKDKAAITSEDVESMAMVCDDCPELIQRSSIWCDAILL